MKIKELFGKGRPVLSYELFPPKQETPIEKLYPTLESLKQLNPDYVSVTYGAGGSNSYRTVELASLIKNCYGIEPLTHLTALYSTEKTVREFIVKLQKNNIQNVLALRGDRITGRDALGVFEHASDLTSFLKNNSDLNVVGAGYPEGHFECESLDKDIDNLKIKVDAGVSHINTQLFFDNEDFYRFIEKVRAKGITVPIQAGIMPIVKKTHIERTVTLSGAKVPPSLARICARYSDEPDALKDAGIAFATNQIADLIAAGADGVHLYIMNNDYVAKRIYENVKTLFGDK